MKRHLIALFRTRWFLALLGLAMLALLIWFVGPLVAIAEHRPLDGPRERLALILLLAVIWSGREAWRMVQARRSNAALMAGLAQQESAQQTNAASEAELAALRKRFEEAISLLRKARLEPRSSLRGAMASLSGQWVYELPWYMFIGAPGSGKTTALTRSGLNFPLAARLGDGPVRGVGGTRNCDWWFTSDAVLIDTAGRYTTQDSDQQGDAAAWQGFLGLLKKYRVRRPINGILLTLSVPDLLETNAARRGAHMAALRQRIEELHESFNIRFPVYVLVTKTDLLDGFTEFFSEFGKEDRMQVWGATLPCTDGASDSLQNLPQEFDLLLRRINERLTDRMQQEPDAQKRARLYLFPQQFAVLQSSLSEFVQQLFAPSQFTQTALVRGVYFTSGTQEGSPIDKVIGELGRALRLESRVVAPARSSSKSFFIHRLLSDVVFAEAGLAGANLRWERRRLLLRRGLLATTAALALLLVGAWTLSYMRNRSYVEAAHAHARKIAQGLDKLRLTSATDVGALLPAWNAVRDAALPPGMQPRQPQWSMSFGLYQGDKLQAAADSAYRRILRDTLLPCLDARLEQQLRTDYRDNPEMRYEALKTYLMLHDPQHFDAAAVRAYAAADWDMNLSRSINADQRRELDAHLDALLSSGNAISPYPADKALIAQVRDALSRTPLASRVLNRLKLQNAAAGLPEFTIAAAGGSAAQLVFARASGEPLTRGVPGLYSVDAYRRVFRPEAERIAARLAQEQDWVLGARTATVATAASAALAGGQPLVEQVRQLYLQEYAKVWEAFVADIRLVPAATLQETIQAARILSGQDSPLPRLLRAIVAQVTLLAPADPARGVVEQAGDKVRAAREDLLRMIGKSGAPAGQAQDARPEHIVDDRFDSLRRLVLAPAPGQPAPVDALPATLNELYTLLVATEAAIREGNVPPASDVPNRIRAEGARMPEPVRSMLSSLSAAGSTQTFGAARSGLSAQMKAAVGDFCTQAIEGRYPFNRSSRRDVTSDDFSRLFANGGLFDQFFQKSLAPLVDVSARPWKFRKAGTADASGNSGALIEFQRAQTIRDVFFRGNAPTPRMQLIFKPLAVDAAIAELTIDVDGQILKYGHTPQPPMQVNWPGPGGSSQIRMQMVSADGASPDSAVFDGPWALLRLFDRARLQPTSQPERYIATWDFGGKKAQLEIMASSIQNPIRLRELEQFRCPGAL